MIPVFDHHQLASLVLAQAVQRLSHFDRHEGVTIPRDHEQRTADSWHQDGVVPFDLQDEALQEREDFKQHKHVASNLVEARPCVLNHCTSKKIDELVLR